MSWPGWSLVPGLTRGPKHAGKKRERELKALFLDFSQSANSLGGSVGGSLTDLSSGQSLLGTEPPLPRGVTFAWLEDKQLL